MRSVVAIFLSISLLLSVSIFLEGCPSEEGSKQSDSLMDLSTPETNDGASAELPGDASEACSDACAEADVVVGDVGSEN